jgi:Protein of unknown function DUF262
MPETPTIDEGDHPAHDSISEAEGFIDIDEREEIAPLHYGITSFGADFPVDGLVKRLDNKDILIPTFDPDISDTASDLVGFQRDFVWTKPQSDRFVESLLLGFPVPGIFLVQGADGVYLVLDGQQRLRTLQAFYKGSLRDKTYRLQQVQDDFRDLTYETLEPDVRRRLDNSIIHATVVKQEVPSEDQSGIYKIFERLNTGGTLLQPQEIRVALFNGPLIGLLRDLNENQDWRVLCGPKSKRLKDQELILRFFAFRARADTYKAPMKEFLNDYTGWNWNLQHESSSELTNAFEATVALIRERFGEGAFRLVRAVNAAVLDSVMTVTSEGISLDALLDATSLGSAYSQLMADTDYRTAVERATAREEQVAMRLSRARHHLLIP